MATDNRPRRLEFEPKHSDLNVEICLVNGDERKQVYTTEMLSNILKRDADYFRHRAHKFFIVPHFYIYRHPLFTPDQFMREE